MPRFGKRLEMLKDVPRLLGTNMPSAIVSGLARLNSFVGLSSYVLMSLGL